MVNPTAFLSVASPATVWVYPTFSAKLTARIDADRFLQIYLVMGVLPMAPVPGNDHAILPNITTAAIFRDYGPLFQSIAGTVWELGRTVADVSVVLLAAGGGQGCRTGDAAAADATATPPVINVFAPPPRSHRPAALPPPSFLVAVSAAAADAARCAAWRGCALNSTAAMTIRLSPSPGRFVCTARAPGGASWVSWRGLA